MFKALDLGLIRLGCGSKVPELGPASRYANLNAVIELCYLKSFRALRILYLVRHPPMVNVNFAFLCYRQNTHSRSHVTFLALKMVLFIGSQLKHIAATSLYQSTHEASKHQNVTDLTTLAYLVYQSRLYSQILHYLRSDSVLSNSLEEHRGPDSSRRSFSAEDTKS